MRVLDAIIPAARSERLSLAEAYFSGGDPFGYGLGLGGLATFNVGGQSYTVPVQTTQPGQKAESIANSFEGYILGGLAGNSVVYSLAATRLRVFTEARFQFQQLNNGRPGDLFGTAALAPVETPWPGGTTGDLLAIMLLHADFAGNAYVTQINGQLVAMRPDWVEIVLGARRFIDDSGRDGSVGMEKLGYNYYEGGRNSGAQPLTFLADAVCHFSPMPDPLAWYRGMSWLTPVIREIQADQAMTAHKLGFFEHAATPNLAVSLKDVTDPVAFEKFVDKMDQSHAGWQNAYKTLYTAGGADVTVIGTDLRQLDFKAVQGAGETRLAAAAGVPPSVAGLSEGLQGSTLNAGNFSASRRQFADVTLAPLWRNVAGSLELLVEKPTPACRLWYDTRDIAFLREDVKDQAQIHQTQAQAIRELFMAGFTPDSIVHAVMSGDFSQLVHSGTEAAPVYSIQVQTPGTTSTKMPSTEDIPPGGPPEKPAIAAPKAEPAPQAGASKKF